MAAVAHHQSTAVGGIRGLVQSLDDPEGLLDAVEGEDTVVLAADHYQLLGGDHDRQVAHIEVAGDAGDVVAGAVVGHHDGVVVGADRAGGHEAVEAMLQAGGVVGGGAASRVAHEDGSLHGDEVTEMGLDGVHHPHDVPDPLADQGATQEQGGHGGALTGGAMDGAAALPEGSLLNGQGGEALGYGADAEVAVATLDGVLIARVLGDAQGDVGPLGVALEGGAEGELARLLLREEEIAMSEVALLGLEGEVDVAVTVKLVLGGDFKEGIAGGEGVQAQKLGELGGTDLAVGLNRGRAVPAKGGDQGLGEGDMMVEGEGIHGASPFGGDGTIIAQSEGIDKAFFGKLSDYEGTEAVLCPVQPA